MRAVINSQINLGDHSLVSMTTRRPIVPQPRSQALLPFPSLGTRLMVPMPLSNKRLGTTEAVQELDNPTAFYTRNSGGHLNRDLHSNLKSFINFRKEKYMTYCLVVSHPQNAGNFIYSKRLTIHVFLLGVFPTSPALPPSLSCQKMQEVADPRMYKFSTFPQ